MFWRLCLCGFVLTSLLGRQDLAAAQARQAETTAAKETQTETTTTTTAEPKKEPRKLQVFKLKHCLPSQFAQLMSVRRTEVARVHSCLGARPVKRFVSF